MRSAAPRSSWLPTVTRARKPLNYFLDAADSPGVPDEARPDLYKLRELAAAEKFAQLLVAAQDAKSKAAAVLDRAGCGFYLAQAQIRLADPHAALLDLEEARAAFRAAGDQWMVVECTDWLSAVLYMLEDPLALSVAEVNLAACRRLQPGESGSRGQDPGPAWIDPPGSERMVQGRRVLLAGHRVGRRNDGSKPAGQDVLRPGHRVRAPGRP